MAEISIPSWPELEIPMVPVLKMRCWRDWSIWKFLMSLCRTSVVVLLSRPRFRMVRCEVISRSSPRVAIFQRMRGKRPTSPTRAQSAA